MFFHDNRMQYIQRVSEPTPGLANLTLEQFGGAQGAMAAAGRYFTQAIVEDHPGRKNLVFDVATVELNRLGFIGTMNEGGRSRRHANDSTDYFRFQETADRRGIGKDR